MDVIERLELIKQLEGFSRDALADECGIKRERLKNTVQRKQRLLFEDLEKVQQRWPEYAYWLTTGLEIPEAGQISPMTKRTQLALKRRPAEG